MKIVLTNISILCALSYSLNGFSQNQKQDEIKAIMKKVADWQIFHFQNAYSKPKSHHPLHWTNAALYTGMVKWAEISDEEKYYNWLKNIGTAHNWELHERVYHADDHAVGQMYLDLYRRYKDTAMVEPTKKHFDFILHHPAKTDLEWTTPFHQDRWNWCDALFMAPPVLAKLYNITGEKKYLTFLLDEYKATTDFLFDQEEKLYYRDERFMTMEDNGTKVFWARGNGWVFAGLVNIMNELEPDSEAYNYFLNIYEQMAKKLLKLQTPEGHWAMSLLGQKYYPTPETSGSSFFIYGLAWGINKGILDKSTYLPAVTKGWEAILRHVTKDGMLGYVQPIGAAPGDAWADKTEVYGTGAFLSAGSEIYKLHENDN